MTNVKRKTLSQKIRFEVFKRDSFKCQYCGKSAPEVILHVDHIIPVSKGGTNDLMNLLTSCQERNWGKSDRTLNDRTEIEKQKKALDELNERRKQLEFMLKWRDGLGDIESDKYEAVENAWVDNCGYTLNANGERSLKRIVKKYDLNLVLDSIEASTDQYLRFDKDGKATHDSVEKSFKMIERIIKQKVNPMSEEIKELYYIRGILKNRLSYVNEHVAFNALKKANDDGISTEELKEIALRVRNWTDFKCEMLELGDYI